MTEERSTLCRRPLVIGVGQDLRGDDAVGRRVAEAFEVAYPGLADVVSLVQLVPELAERISAAPSAVFVDAREGDSPARVEIQPVQAESPSTGVSHIATPQELLASSRTLFGAHPPAAVVTVTGGCFEFGERLSPEVQRAIPKAVQTIRDWLWRQKVE